MGIRFRCHHCKTELHVKDFQAGKRGRCPECDGPFRIPLEDAPHSLDPQIKLPESGANISQATPGLTAQEEVNEAKVNEAKAEKKAPARAAADASGTAAAASKASSKIASKTAASPPAASGKVPTASGSGIATSGNSIGAGRSAVPADSPSAALAPPDLPAPPPASPPPQPALPRALQTAADGKWYVRPPSGGQYGPAASAAMWQWLTENRVGRDALVWTEGWPEWVIAETAFDDFFTAAPGLQAEIPPVPVAFTGELNQGTLGTSQPAVAGAAAAEPLLGDRNRADRKQKRRRNYTLMIVGLTVTMLVLIATLIYVLGSQSS